MAFSPHSGFWRRSYSHGAYTGRERRHEAPDPVQTVQVRRRRRDRSNESGCGRYDRSKNYGIKCEYRVTDTLVPTTASSPSQAPLGRSYQQESLRTHGFPFHAEPGIAAAVVYGWKCKSLVERWRFVAGPRANPVGTDETALRFHDPTNLSARLVAHLPVIRHRRECGADRFRDKMEGLRSVERGSTVSGTPVARLLSYSFAAPLTAHAVPVCGGTSQT